MTSNSAAGSRLDRRVVSDHSAAIGGTTTTYEATMTAAQLLAARLLLGWSRDKLGKEAATGPSFIRMYEVTGRLQPAKAVGRRCDRLAAIRTALEAAGIDFSDGNGSARKITSDKNNRLSN